MTRTPETASEYRAAPEYDHRAAEEEIRAGIKAAGRKLTGEGALKKCAQETGIGYKNLVRRLKESEGRAFLTFQEVGRIAAWVSRHYEPTPPGWPIVTFAAWRKHLSDVRNMINATERAGK